MKISFIGHSYHQVTQSSRFFIEILETLGSVSYFWSTGPSDTDLGSDPSGIADADLVVVWQDVASARRFVQQDLPNAVFVPMYDACTHLERSDWRQLLAAGRLKILNFSSALHSRLQRYGAHSSAYFQYYPDPSCYDPVSDFEALRGFFWQRRSDPNWTHVQRLTGQAAFDSFTLHLAVDPGAPVAVLPSEQEQRERNIELTRWFPNRGDLVRKLREANVYFAPRPDEGIGLAFLEAMAMGMAVCAHDAPTHNEYIVDGVNGYLFNMLDPQACDWARAAELGRRARESVEKGHARWLSDRTRLLDFLVTPQQARGSWPYARPYSGLSAVDPASADSQAQAIRSKEGGRRLQARADRMTPEPRITLATVVRNAPEALARTLASVVAQTFADREVMVIDGDSGAATRSVIDAYTDQIDYWYSAPDDGPYDAMNTAAGFARGRWILFINAGDTFVDDDALMRFVSGIPDSADFVLGHHVYASASDGIEDIHRCVDFEHTWQRLLAGRLDADWLAGIPGHQAVLTRVARLREHRYDTTFRVAADHEFMFRLRALGASFHVMPVVVSRYVGGGLSAMNLDTCVSEWWAIARRYAKKPSAADRFFGELLRDALCDAAPGAIPFWKRRSWREHPALYAGAGFRRLCGATRRWLEARRVLRSARRMRMGDSDLSRHCVDWYGLSHYEDWGRWTDGTRVRFLLMEPMQGRTQVTVRCSSVVPGFHGRRVELRIGAQSRTFTINTDTPVIRGEFTPERPLHEVEIEIPEPVRPADIGLSPDTRELGLCIRELTVKSQR